MAEEGGTIARRASQKSLRTAFSRTFPPFMWKEEGGMTNGCRGCCGRGKYGNGSAENHQISMGENYGFLSQLTHDDNSDCCSSVLCLR
ncbi:unnamed protein product [Lasius platythorax]|uniref:Uncharacterized protein n=1 Tax=Lasius platythorax TaxID=488582 RepID=A0AAV2NWE8_9HYME